MMCQCFLLGCIDLQSRGQHCNNWKLILHLRMQALIPKLPTNRQYTVYGRQQKYKATGFIPRKVCFKLLPKSYHIPKHTRQCCEMMKVYQSTFMWCLLGRLTLIGCVLKYSGYLKWNQLIYSRYQNRLNMYVFLSIRLFSLALQIIVSYQNS